MWKSDIGSHKARRRTKRRRRWRRRRKEEGKRKKEEEKRGNVGKSICHKSMSLHQRIEN